MVQSTVPKPTNSVGMRRIVGVVKTSPSTCARRTPETARTRRGGEPRQERVPSRMSHELRTPLNAMLAFAAARAGSPPPTRPTSSPGGADPAGRLAPAGHDQRRARPLAHRVGQPCCRSSRSACRRSAGQPGDGRHRGRAAVCHQHRPRRRHRRADGRRHARQADPREPAQQTPSSTTARAAASTWLCRMRLHDMVEIAVTDTGFGHDGRAAR